MAIQNNKPSTRNFYAMLVGFALAIIFILNAAFSSSSSYATANATMLSSKDSQAVHVQWVKAHPGQ